MRHLFPHARATLKASSYFTTTLSGFLDSSSRFKVFDHDEAPTNAVPFIHIEQQPAEENQNNGWGNVFLIFHIVGDDHDKETLWIIAQQIPTIFDALDQFAAVGGDDPVAYQRIGKAVFSTGRNPVTTQVYVSVGLEFGIV